MKLTVLLYDADVLFDIGLFKAATEFYDPDTMLNSSIIYYLYSEDFYAEELRESINVDVLIERGYDEYDAKHNSLIADDLFNNWIDDFYMRSGYLLDDLTKDKRWLFVEAKYIEASEIVTIRFKERKPGQPYTFLN